ncbi:hypothetical protein BaRGS_00032148 [Batillaria attramentaria]|uniref:Reverse transcriptase domain-containing protein n=1 Tax=Batillaria attramentaria TaxID=370345 RepID=A0ABD0JP01_9CAEN
MLKRNVSEPSNSSWASPVNLVEKKDNTIRFCIDYRKLNQISTKDSYPIPRLDQCLDALAGNVWFSTMDLQSGFWQVPLEKSSKEKTAFRTKMGLFHFNVRPFGLTNSPATFERLMKQTLMDLQWEECLLFIDDLTYWSKRKRRKKQRLTM